MAPAGESVTVAAAALDGFLVDLFVKLGAPEDHAAVAAAALVAADLEGLESHGAMLVPLYVDRILAGSVAPAAAGSIVSDSGSTIVLDAENGFGQVSAARATALAIARSGEHGLAVVAVRNGFHLGAAGYWARQMAKAGRIGIVLSNTRPLMPAPGGAERLVGNNPIAIALPGNDEPIVVDMALSASAMGKIRLAAAAGEPIPDGWATDAAGQPTQDPKAAIAGMLLPAAGAKGFGLALAIDLLCGGLSSGAVGDAVRPLYGNPAEPYGCAHLFLAIDVAPFRPLGEFAGAVDGFADRIRRSRPADSTHPVHVPGDRAVRQRATSSGICHLAPSTVEALRRCAERADVDLPEALHAPI